MSEDYGWTIERYNPSSGGECYEQSALPWRACKAFSWTPEKKRCITQEEAEQWAAKATKEADAYWQARMSR